MKQAVTLATVAVKFLERTGLAPSTIKTYELTLLNFLAEYGSWPIEIISKQTLIEYLDSLSHLKYTTHHKHQAILQRYSHKISNTRPAKYPLYSNQR